jgi:hypothetical protein
MQGEYSQWANTRPQKEIVKSAVLDLNMELLWEREWQQKHSASNMEDPLFGSNLKDAARIIREWWTSLHGTDS